MAALLADSTKVRPYLTYMLPAIDGLSVILVYGDKFGLKGDATSITSWKYAVSCGYMM